VDGSAAVAEVMALAALYDGRSDLSTPVPSCPDWTLRGLADHVGGVHRWAAHHVKTYAPERVSAASLGIEFAASDAEVADWLRAGAAVLEDAFGPADGDVPMWGWGADKHARFWPRRMLHETAVHRADAALALGLPFDLDPAVAADGVDELLDNLPHAAYFSPTVEELKGDGQVLSFESSDGGAAWAVTLGPDGYTWAREQAQSPDATLRADGADLLLVLYGRRSADDPAVTVAGDRAVLDHWLAHAKL
jgi:uncharacterized protein (TIGR03083 family)